MNLKNFSKPEPLITLPAYERIYKVVNSILVNENADLTKACMFYSVYGAHILAKHHRIDAKPVGGLAVYHLGNDSQLLTFGTVNEEGLTSTYEAFHFWVEAEGWLIDFMAPVYPQLLRQQGAAYSVQPKMMQKPLSMMSNSPLSVKSVGDFYLESNPQLDNMLVTKFGSSRAYANLAEIAGNWYRKPPKKVAKSISIANAKGVASSLSLSGKKVVGAW